MTQQGFEAGATPGTTPGSLGTLSVLDDGEDASILHPDPRRWRMLSDGNRIAEKWASLNSVMTAAWGILAAVTLMDLDYVREFSWVLLGVPALIILASWTLLWFAASAERRCLHGSEEFAERFRAFQGTQPLARYGTLTSVTFEASHDVHSCVVMVEFDTGEILRAQTARYLSDIGEDGEKLVRRASCAPQEGDQVAVFTDPSGMLPPLVQANHSWSLLRGITLASAESFGVSA